MQPAASTRVQALPLPCKRLLSRSEAAAYAGVSPVTFDKMRADGLMPQPVHIYGRVLWDLVALNAAIDALSIGEDAGGPDLNEWD